MLNLMIITKILFCGLQGSGKTTTIAKVANFIKKDSSLRRRLVFAAQALNASESNRGYTGTVTESYSSEDTSDAFLSSVLGVSESSLLLSEVPLTQMPFKPLLESQ